MKRRGPELESEHISAKKKFVPGGVQVGVGLDINPEVKLERIKLESEIKVEGKNEGDEYGEEDSTDAKLKIKLKKEIKTEIKIESESETEENGGKGSETEEYSESETDESSEDEADGNDTEPEVQHVNETAEEHAGNGSINAEPEVQRQRANVRQGLFIFLDCETTGLSTDNDSIIKISAKVFGCRHSFCKLVKTTQNISPIVTSMTGITNKMLSNKKPLQFVLPKFLKWIKKVSNSAGIRHHPVLMAHYGFNFEFPILMPEIEKQRSSLTRKLHFCDPLPQLRKLQRSGHEDLQSTALGKEALYIHFFGEPYQVHTDLEDVKAMEKLFTESWLKNQLENLPIYNFKKMKQVCHEKRSRRELRQYFDITYAQAQRLASLGLDYDVLMLLRDDCTSDEEFKEELHSQGVNSKPLREIVSEQIQTF